MITSTLFVVAALSSLTAVNGAIVQRDTTPAFLSPQPTTQATTSPQPGGGGPAPTTTSVTGSGNPPSSLPASTPTASLPPLSSVRSSIPPSSIPPSSIPPSSIPRSGTPPASTPPASITRTSNPPATTPPASVPPASIPVPVTQSCPPASVPPANPSGSPGASPVPPSGAANCNGVQQWQASFAYTAGNKVIFNSQLYTALQWTWNNAPPAHPDQWAAGGPCAQPVRNKADCTGVAAWQQNVAYTSGDRVTFNGHLWSAVQWTQSNAPADASGVWKDEGVCN